MDQMYILAFVTVIFLILTFLSHRLMMKNRFAFFPVLSLGYLAVSFMCLVNPLPDILTAIVEKNWVPVKRMSVHGNMIIYIWILLLCTVVAFFNIGIVLVRKINKRKAALKY